MPQYNFAPCLPPDICYLCLSRDRKVFSLSANIRHLFGFLTDYYPQTDARVCWECRATLERLRRFKEQTKQAVCSLERARTGQQLMNFECLSKLYPTQMLFIDLLVYDDENAIRNDDLCFGESGNEISDKFEVEIELEDEKPNIKSELTEEIDLGVDIICENNPDQIDEDDNSVGSKCHRTIDLTEDNTDYATESDTEQINMQQTELQIDAPSSSAEGEITSKNAKNSPAIKKTQGLLKTKIKRKKPMVRRIKRNLNPAEQLINKERLAEQRKYELYQQGKDFECDHCGKSFQRRRQIFQHIMGVHFKSLMCDRCPYTCQYISQLRKHNLVHLDPSHQPHQCQVCHKRFTNKLKLLVHTRLHTGERTFKCDACGKAFISKEVLIGHVKNKHVITEPTTEKSVQLSTKPVTTVESGAHGNRRWLSHHNSNYTIIKNSEKITYECNVCKEIFQHRKAFYRHYYSTHKSIPCTECDQTFKHPSLLANHVRIVHRGERYQCNICGATIRTKSALRVHILTHSNEKRYKCNECSAAFKSYSGMWGHKLIHKAVRPHQCNICKERFTTKSHLVGHMKIHRKDRQFECDICNKKCQLKRNLNNHIKTHSKEQQ